MHYSYGRSLLFDIWGWVWPWVGLGHGSISSPGSGFGWAGSMKIDPWTTLNYAMLQLDL